MSAFYPSSYDEGAEHQLRTKLAKAVEALRIARVHVANNAEGWSVGRASSRADLEVVDMVLAALEKTE